MYNLYTKDEDLPTLIMAVGLPCSGKSTFIDGQFNLITILSSDHNIMQRLKRNETYAGSFKKYVDEAVKEFFADVEKYGKLASDIVIDRTNLTVKSRALILDKFPHHNKVCFDFSVGKETHASMIAGRPEKIVPKEIIESMAKSYEKPTKDEGFDTIYRVHID